MLEEVNCCIGYYTAGIYFDTERNHGDLVHVRQPVLDIKPYLPYCDSVPGAIAPSWVKVLIYLFFKSFIPTSNYFEYMVAMYAITSDCIIVL